MNYKPPSGGFFLPKTRAPHRGFFYAQKGTAMEFTRRTYRVAIRRSIRKEAEHHAQYALCFRGPEAWLKQHERTRKLQARKRRERK